MIKITRITEKPLTHMGRVAGFCYDTTNEKWFPRIAKQCMEENHGRVMEFESVEFEFSGYSAKVVRELFRHKMASELQASTRYIDYTKQFEYVTPHSVTRNPEALKVWEETMKTISESMEKMKELGVPTEDFTNVLPLAYSTKGVYVVNLRSLIHMFGVRSCTTAYLEFRMLMNDIKKAIKDVGDEEWNFIADNYFAPKCIRDGFCTEYKRHCGLRPTKKEAEIAMGIIK